VDELKQWLSAIESGISPDYRDRFPPNIYLVQYGQPGLQLICWPTGTRSPSKYPDITLLESGKTILQRRRRETDRRGRKTGDVWLIWVLYSFTLILLTI
jgi:hypothetical protein